MDEQTRLAIRARMERAGGVKIVCVGCLREGRHLPGSGKRLRDKRCRWCGSKPRPVWWRLRYPAKFLAEHRQANAQVILPR